MSALEALAATSDNLKITFRRYRQDLVSLRGNLSSGSLATTMNLTLNTKKSPPKNTPDKVQKAEVIPAQAPLPLPNIPPHTLALNQQTTTDSILQPEIISSSEELITYSEPENNRDPIKQIFISRERGSGDYGFVWTPAGSEKIITSLSREINRQQLHLAELASEFYFMDLDKATAWHQASASLQKRLIARDIKQMIRKTDIQYRTHGDRLHYLVIGKVATTTARECKNYPLFLFACEHCDEKKQTATIETSGFVNFWLDQEIYDGEISRQLGQLEIDIDHDFTNKIQALATKLNQLTLPDFQKVEADPNFSSLGIITGFETEYVDRAWEKIL